MNKKIWVFIVFVTFVLACYSIGTKEHDKNDDVIKIGVSLPLTGNLANTGIASKNSLLIAMDKIKKMDTKYKYELVIEDDAYSAMKVTPALTKLLNFDKVNAVITTGSVAGNVVTNYNNNISDGFIHINGAAYDNSIAEGKNNFLIGGATKSLAKKFVGELVKRGYKKIAVVRQNSVGPKATADAILEELKKTDIDIKFIETVNVGDRDYRFLISKIRKHDVDLVLAQLFVPAIDILKKQIIENKLDVDYTCILSIEASVNKKMFEGDWFVSDIIFDDWFGDEMDERFGVDVNYGSPNVYDALFMLVEAFENSETNDVETIGSYIRVKKDFDGLMGPLQAHENGIFEVEPKVKVIKGSKAIIIGE